MAKSLAETGKRVNGGASGFVGGGVEGEEGHAQAAEQEEPTKCATKRRRRSVRRSVDDEVCDEVWELDVIPGRL
jgi:hypothetical protein